MRRRRCPKGKAWSLSAVTKPISISRSKRKQEEGVQQNVEAKRRVDLLGNLSASDIKQILETKSKNEGLVPLDLIDSPMGENKVSQAYVDWINGQAFKDGKLRRGWKLSKAGKPYKPKGGKFGRKGKRKRSYSRGSSGRSRSRTITGATVPGSIQLGGRGGYWADRWNDFKGLIPTGAFSSVGNIFGPVGGAVGNLVSKMVGFGDYKVSNNSLLLPMGAPIPQFGNMSNATILAHREFIQDITIPAVPATFTLQSFPIQAASSTLFPWLSQLAVNFDQYQMIGLVFEFKSTSSDFGTTTSLAMGTVIMATDYDAVDVNYTSKLQMENSQYCMSGKPSTDILHPIECAPNLTSTPILYTRAGAVPSGKDARLYDLGNFQIATVGLPTGSSGVIGELWVTYQVALYKPQLISGQIGGNLLAAHFYAVTGVSAGGGAYFGNPAPAASTGSLLAATVSNAGVITMPDNTLGTFALVYLVTGASTTLTNAMTVTLASNLVGVTLLAGATSAASTYTAGETAKVAWVVYYFKYKLSQIGNNTITFSVGTLPGTITSMDLYITQVNSNIVT